RIDRHHIFLMAAGIAFNIILYLIPLILVIIFAVNLTFGSENLAVSIELILMDFLLPTTSAEEIIHKIIEEVREIMNKSTVLGPIGIFMLLWLSSILISSLRVGLNRIFEIPSPNFFMVYRLKDMLMTLALTVLILVYAYVVPFVDFFQSFMDQNFPEPATNIISDLLLTILSFVTSFVLFYVIFRSVPNRKIHRRIRFVGTIMCVVLIEASRYVFVWYVGSVSNYGKFYGSFAVLVSMALWIYYSSMIILLSAEISKFIFDCREAVKYKKVKKEEQQAKISDTGTSEETDPR
ncbi:MAG: YihY/virulence factor BrkB family protein, partial [Bacteroidota bacterium]